MSEPPHHPNPSSNGLAVAPPHPPPPPPPPPEALASAGTKRQRRPSVRLGDIGERPASAIPNESYIRRCKQLNVPVPSHYLTAAKLTSSSKTRPLTHLVSEEEEGEDKENIESVRRAKVRRGTVRKVRLNWCGRGGEEDGEREFEESVSPVKELGRSRDLDVDVPSDSNERNWGNGRLYVGENRGVRAWLNELGLGRYTPVFEMHEVDGEVLPLLTLEDLKDMGINAVGSRRKMYSAIQRLGKCFR